MISSTEELDTVNALVNDACKQLTKEGHINARPRVGIMIEVPAAISQIPSWAHRIDFISIGSNDLSQYLLALDRNNARVAARYDHLHPAVVHEVNRVMKKAKRHNLPVSLCGEMAADPLAVILLLGMGVRTLSMSASKLLRIKSVIRTVTLGRCEELLQQALCLDSATEIRELIENGMNDSEVKQDSENHH
jgi:phosphotransferase system enzyme I (PtsI)/phosphotransferase system enzyme I (PtsP)